MLLQNYKEHQPQISWSIQSPVVITAAHSGKLNRGGALYKEKLRIHLREKYTSTLALRWAYQIQQILSGNQLIATSYCFWNMQHQFNQFDFDPNYLTDSNLHLSPFHQFLHNQQIKFNGQPMIHIDIHGKKNRTDNYELDLGMDCLFKHFDNHQQILELKQFFEINLNKLLNSFPKMNGFNAKLNSDPYLSGNWGGNIYTMNEQACMMSIPSIQLEIPKRMRKYLFDNYEVSKQFCQILVDAYKLIFQWKNQMKLKCLCKVNDLQINSVGHQEVVQMEKKYVIWENKLSKEKKEKTI